MPISPTAASGQRTLASVQNCEQTLWKQLNCVTEEDEKLLASAKGYEGKAGQAISEQALQKYVEVMVGMIWEANKYIDEMARVTQKKAGTRGIIMLWSASAFRLFYQPHSDSANRFWCSVCLQMNVPLHLDDSYRLKKIGTLISKPVGFSRIECPAEELTNVASARSKVAVIF
jgi:methionyl-tRNA synthetase